MAASVVRRDDQADLCQRRLDLGLELRFVDAEASYVTVQTVIAEEPLSVGQDLGRSTL